MALNIQDGTSGIFDIQAGFIRSLIAVNDARRGTVPDELDAALRTYKSIAGSLNIEAAIDGVAASVDDWRAAQDAFMATVQNALVSHLIAVCEQDRAFLTPDLETCLQYLIEQMDSQGYYVAANTVALSLSAQSGGTSDIGIAYATRRGDGKVQQNIIPDSYFLEVQADGTLQIQGTQGTGSLLDALYPRGSAVDTILSVVGEGAALNANGTFESATIEGVPDGWIVNTGSVGGTVKLTLPAKQTVTISGTPTSGSYVLRYTDPLTGNVYATEALPYDASGGQVQTALRALPRLGAIEVATEGDSPNFTHAIEFIGVAGEVAQLSSVSQLNAGSIAHATEILGDRGAYRGRSLIFHSNGAELTEVYCPLAGLAAETVYFCHFRTSRTGTAPAAGVLTVDIVDGIGGSVTADAAGNSNTLSFNAADVANGSHDARFFAFCLKPSEASPVYLRIRISTAVTAGTGIHFDDVFVAPGTELYDGGPFVAAFVGRTVVAGDRWTLVATNNRDGLWQDWYDRIFEMRDKGLLLPTAGSSEIPESLITEETSSSSSSDSSISSSSSESESSSSESSSPSSSTSSSESSSTSSSST